MDEYLEKIYFDIGNPNSYGGVSKLYKAAKNKYPQVTLKYVKLWLSKQNAYTLHKPARRNFSRNIYLVSYIDEQWQADIVDMRQFFRQNQGYRYILTIIDCFSKYLFAYPLKTKRAPETLSKFKTLFNLRKPIKLQTDRGGEFDNKVFREFCKLNKVIYFTTKYKLIKCAIIERANRTLKEKLFRYFTQHGTRKYFDILDKTVDSYNNSVHRSTKIRPSEVNRSNEKYVFSDMFGYKNFKNMFFKQPHTNGQNLYINDDVRIKYDLNRLEKSYYPLWTDPVYKINRVLQKYGKPQYSVKLANRELERRFYPDELQKISVSQNSYYRVEKILRYRTRNGIREALVKWLNYPSTHNQWIPATHVIKLK